MPRKVSPQKRTAMAKKAKAKKAGIGSGLASGKTAMPSGARGKRVPKPGLKKSDIPKYKSGGPLKKSDIPKYKKKLK
jgi:hypothetical protein